MIAPHPQHDERWLESGWKYEVSSSRLPAPPSSVAKTYSAISAVVGKHPIALLAVSISIGALAGCLIKRK